MPDLRYQKLLADFVVENGLTVLVETGMGVSTIHLLAALDKLKAGTLTSIDPAPWYGEKIEHNRLTHLKDNSFVGLKRLVVKFHEPWDLFLHDGDHDTLCQTFEYNLAWGCLRKGGWLASDDVDWGQHGAWKRFCAEHKLKPIKLDSLEMVQKDTDPVRAPLLSVYYAECLAKAYKAEADWLRSGGKNSDAFAENRKGYK
jgi:hypothetical protein